MLFSQRIGIRPVKDTIQVDSADSDLRNALWNVVFTYYWGSSNANANELDVLSKFLWLKHFKQTIDTYQGYSQMGSNIRNIVMNNEWYEMYDLLERIANNYPNIAVNSKFMNDCNSALEEELSAYRFVGGRITRITSEEEITAIETALKETQTLKPINDHLARALELLADRKVPDYRNSIKESISAVEAMCNRITGKATTLGQALKTIEGKIPLHPALKNSFSSLYGYTSDAQGVRHALLDSSTLDFEDAKFMLVSCSAFINYLITKSSKAGIQL